eukprot:g3480.t1
MLPVSEFLLHALRRSTSCCASIDWRRWIPVSAFKVDPILLLAAFALCQGGNVLFRRYCMVDEAENRFRAAHFIVVAEVLRALGCAVAILFLSPRPKDDFALSVSGAPGRGKSVEDHRMEEEDDPARLPKKAARSARSDAWSGRHFPVQISKPPGEAASPFFRNVLPLALPAILYASQNQLQMYTVACLEASSYTLLMQTRVFFACAFSVFFFGRFINLYQQAGLLTAATALLLLVSSFPTEEDKGSSCRMRSLPPLSETQVACLVTVYCGFVAGFAGVITESFFKTPGWSFLVRNLQLAVFSVLVLFVYIECFARERGLVITRRNGARVVQRAATDAIGRRGAHVVPEAFEVGLGGTGDIKHGAVETTITLVCAWFFHGFTPRTWLMALLEAGNTLFTGYVIQELDVVQCDLAQVGALLFVVIASSCGVFGAEGFVGGSGVLAMAALLLCAGMFLYNRGELYFVLVEGASPRSAPVREDRQEQDRERKLHEQRKFVAVYRATYGFSVMSAALVFVYLLYFAVFSIQPLHREGARATGVRAKPKQLKPLIIEAQQQDNMLKQEVAKNDTLTNLAEGASVSLGIKIELESGDGAERDGAEGDVAVGKGGRNRSNRRGRVAKEREPEAESRASLAASGIAAARQDLLDDLRAGGGEDPQAGLRFGSRDEEKSPDVRRPDRGRKKDFAAEKAFRGFLMQAGTQKKGAR